VVIRRQFGPLRNALAHLSGDAAAEVLVEEFAWVDLLPAADRLQFVSDFARAVGASAELGHWSVVAQVLVEWKAIAAVSAGGLGGAVRGNRRRAGLVLPRRAASGRVGRRREPITPEGR
jgi:hypothetical protein